MGRRSKINHKVIQKLGDAIGVGATVETACDYAGISVDTFYNWQKRAANHLAQMEEWELDDPAPDERIFVEFVEHLVKKKGEGAVGFLAAIQTIAQNSNQWTAYAWILERMYPESYGRNATLNVTGQSTISVKTSRAGEEGPQRTNEEIVKIGAIMQETGILDILRAKEQEDGPTIG
jgi:transposase